jgi:hypothetical protein
LKGFRARLEAVEALIGWPAPALAANFVDPITQMLRTRIAAGAQPTTTTPEARAAAEARLRERLARAGQVRT